MSELVLKSYIQEGDISKAVVDCAFQVHRQLGPGLLESAYEECLCILLKKVNISFQRQVQMPIFFDSQKIDIGYRVDLLIENKLIIELKAVEKIIPLHEAQIITYMRLSKISTGLLINFNSKMFKEGIRRFVL
jgi:GxxExxY protein